METTIDEVKIEIESSSDQASSSLEKLAESIGKLETKLGPALEKLKAFKENLSGLASGLSNITIDNVGIQSLTESLSKINQVKKPTNFTAILSQLKEIPTITKTLSDKEIANFTTRIKQLSTALEPLSSQISTVGAALSQLPSDIQNVNASLKTLNGGGTSATSIFKTLGAKILGIDSSKSYTYS